MASSYNGVPLPAGGSPITYSGGKMQVPDNPIIPYIEGDGTGRDIWAASQRVFDGAVEKAYGANARFTGMKSSPAKKHLPNSRTGCRKARLTLRAISTFPSKARSPRQ